MMGWIVAEFDSQAKPAFSSSLTRIINSNIVRFDEMPLNKQTKEKVGGMLAGFLANMPIGILSSAPDRLKLVGYAIRLCGDRY